MSKDSKDLNESTKYRGQFLRNQSTHQNTRDEFDQITENNRKHTKLT